MHAHALVAFKTSLCCFLLIANIGHLNAQQEHHAALIEFAGKQLVINAARKDQFAATAIPEVQFAQVSQSGVFIVNQNQSMTETQVHITSFDAFPRSWEKVRLDLSPIAQSIIDFKATPVFHFSEDGEFLLVACPQDRDERKVSQNESTDEVAYRFGVWRSSDREFKLVGFVQTPDPSYLDETANPSFSNLNKNMVVAIDFYGMPSVIDLVGHCIAPISFESCKGKLDPSVFCSEEHRRIVSFSVCDGFDHVLEFAVWNLEGSLLCERTFLVDGNAGTDIIGRRQSGMFLSEQAFLIAEKQFTGVVFGTDYDKFFRIDLNVPNGYQIATIVQSSSELFTAFAVPSERVPSEQEQTGVYLVGQDFHLYLEPGERVSVFPMGWRETAVDFMSEDILQK